MNGKAVKIFQKYTGEQRAAHAASHRLFHQQRAAIGETFWTHPDVPNIAFKTRKDANAAALRQAGRGEGCDEKQGGSR